jgi:N-acetylmuramoyl-L-alanine amidase
VFRQQTEDALIEFQRNTGLNTDGMVGEATIAQLKRLKKATPEGKKTVPDRHNGYVGPVGLEGLRVAVDALRGGDDVGGRGVAGLTEKDVNLAVAKALGSQLESCGADVTLVRSSDIELGPYERAELAQAVSPQILISIAHGWHRNPQVSGAATYYFQRGSYASESGRRLAGYMVKALVERLGRLDLHTHGRAYACLREIPCVSVLVEAGFISHAHEGGSLGRERGIQQEADAIVAGLKAFLERL